MLVYPHSPIDSMAQLVPCSAAFPQPLMQQPNSAAIQASSTLADFNQQQQHNGGGQNFLEVPYAGGQTVPSSPTFSTWNYSPPSYWSDYNRSPPMVIKSEPLGCNNSQTDEIVAASSLEELLDDYTFDYYSDIKDLEENNNISSSKPITIKQEEQQPNQGHALLRQCLRPAADDYQQRCHLQFLNQIGSAIAALPPAQQQHQEMSIKTEKPANGAYWPNGNPNSAQGLASVLSLVMEQVNEEVRSTCEILGVSPNPSQWSVDDVRAWLLWTSRQCALGPIPLERFHLEGAVLVALTEEEFRSRAPQGGDTLYAKLDIWRSAWNQRSAAAAAASKAATVSTPQMVPTIQVDEPCADMSDLLACWINTTQDLQQPQQSSSNSMLSAGQHLLAVPSPASTSSQRGALSPYSDHTHSGSEDMASEMEEIEEEEDEERAGSSASCRTGQTAPTPSPNGSHIHLWQFLKELLSQPAVHGSAIRWLDRQRGVFKIEDSVRVAKLWGKRKNRPAMNYDKLSRSIRQYYRKGIMKKTERSQRLVYQFCQPYAL